MFRNLEEWLLSKEILCLHDAQWNPGNRQIIAP